ncbi:MAG: hypothetical protein PHX51_01555 [Clostridia bacterium]|nr:hypothetical protein [Clostridia bacterium]
MNNNLWKCECGTINETDTCTNCNKPRPTVAAPSMSAEEMLRQQMIQQQMIQQQMMQQQMAQQEQLKAEAERSRQRELERVQAEEVAKYREEKKKGVFFDAINPLAGSWMVLVLAIAASLAALVNLVNMFTNFGFFKFGYGLVSVALSALVCAGFWVIWAGAKKRNLSAKGIGLIKGAFTTYQVFAYIVLAFAMIVVFLASSIAAGTGGFLNDLLNTAEVDLGFDLSGLIGAGIAILLVVYMIVAALVVCYFVFVGQILNDAKNRLNGKIIAQKKFIASAIFLFLMVPSQILIMLNASVINVIAGLSAIILYGFGGVVCILYGKALLNYGTEIDRIEKMTYEDIQKEKVQ